ncbi:cupin domain-containing protein [Jatrophihabitans sp. DSM 45814]
MTAAPPATLWDSILQRSAAERERVRAGRSTVTRAELEPEVTPFGILRWYLHNDLQSPVAHALYFCELEIPAGSRSGQLRHQGGIVHLVVEGSGFTRFDGVEHEWEKKDVIAIPVRPEGVVFQHVNNGTGPARLVMSWPNLDSALGPEGGVLMEILEPAPEYSAVHNY